MNAFKPQEESTGIHYQQEEGSSLEAHTSQFQLILSEQDRLYLSVVLAHMWISRSKNEGQQQHPLSEDCDKEGTISQHFLQHFSPTSSLSRLFQQIWAPNLVSTPTF